MVIVDACVDGMGGFQDSNTTHTKNLTIKRQNYNLIVKEMKLSIIIFVIIVIIVLQQGFNEHVHHSYNIFIQTFQKQRPVKGASIEFFQTMLLQVMYMV
jgi:hypothetical protein